MDKVISFIVPVYNKEKYIVSCLDSIFALETYGNIGEVIVVDDGSTDQTSFLLYQYSLTHPLKVITQANKGLGAARNVGLKAATGDYAYFIDSDDRLLNVDTRSLFVYMNDGIDIIGVNIIRSLPDGILFPYRIFTPNYNHIYIPAKEYVRKRNFMSSVCAYLFRREFLVSEGLSFCEGIYHEDEDFTPRALAMAKCFVSADVDLYEYFERGDSITSTVDKMVQKQRLRDMIKIERNLNAFLINNPSCHDSIEYKIDYLAVDILRILIRQRHDKSFRKEIVAGLSSQNLFPLRWHFNIKYIAFNVFLRIFL